MQTILFENKESVKALELKDLKQTLTLADYNKKYPVNRPLEHHKYIEEIQEVLDKNNISSFLEDIFVAKADSSYLPALDPERQGNINAYLFERLVTRIRIPNTDSGENELAIGLGYNKNGLTLAWGLNVKVCQNMSIFGQNLLTTYGSNKMPYDKLKNVLSDWCHNIDQKISFDRAIFKAMVERKVEKNEMINLIGKLQLKAVENAYININVNAPLNIGQVSSFSKNLLKENKLETSTNLYELYNYGTYLLKPKKTDIVTIYDDIKNLGNFIIEEYQLN